MATSHKQDCAFRDEAIGTEILENAIDWIRNNLDPEDVFDNEQLAIWADENGYEITNGDNE